MQSNEQLDLWKRGILKHRQVEGLEGGECLPDFSCCKPHLLAPQDERDEFCSAGPTRRAQMLCVFLDRMLEDYLKVGGKIKKSKFGRFLYGKENVDRVNSSTVLIKTEAPSK